MLDRRIKYGQVYAKTVHGLFYILMANLSPVYFMGTTYRIGQVVPSRLGYLGRLVAQE